MHRFRFLNSRAFKSTTMTTTKLPRIIPSKEEYDFQRVLLISKTTRFEMEKQNNPGLNEDGLRDLMIQRGSAYVVKTHDEHKTFENKLIQALDKLKVNVKIINRYERPVDLINWADTIISVGGDGTYLMAANKIVDQSKPVIGLNSCPDSSTGYLCLPKRYSKDIYKTLCDIKERKFTWAYRTRIRVTLVGKNIEKTCYSVHESTTSTTKNWENLNLDKINSKEDMYVLPNLALNEVFIAESVPASVSYLDISVNGGELISTKNSGVLVCTGSGSSSWSFTMNRISHEVVEKILSISGHKNANIDEIVEKYNNLLRYASDDERMDYTIRDLIPMSMWPKMPNLSSKGCASKILIKSQCRSGNLVIDGGCSYHFNSGITAILETDQKYVLKTIKLLDDPTMSNL